MIPTDTTPAVGMVALDMAFMVGLHMGVIATNVVRATTAKPIRYREAAPVSRSPEDAPQLPRKPPHLLKPCVAESVTELIRIGASVRDTMLYACVAKGTVLRYKRLFLAGGGVIENCECGQASGHRGWCAHLFAYSAKRQAVVYAMHARRRAEETK